MCGLHFLKGLVALVGIVSGVVRASAYSMVVRNMSLLTRESYGALADLLLMLVGKRWC